MESRQAEIDFTKEQLANLRLRLDSIKATEELKKDENEISTIEIEDQSNLKENQAEILKQRVIQLESQLKTAHSKVNIIKLRSCSSNFIYRIFYFLEFEW